MPHQGWRELAVREGAGHGGAALAAGKVHLQDERPDAADAQHCAAYGHQAPCTFELTYQGARRASLSIHNAQDAGTALALHGVRVSHAVHGALHSRKPWLHMYEAFCTLMQPLFKQTGGEAAVSVTVKDVR